MDDFPDNNSALHRASSKAKDNAVEYDTSDRVWTQRCGRTSNLSLSSSSSKTKRLNGLKPLHRAAAQFAGMSGASSAASHDDDGRIFLDHTPFLNQGLVTRGTLDRIRSFSRLF
eukprot:2454060-Amphidinium_carterae.2